MINKNVSNLIMNDFNKGKEFFILGARQVGKTTLLQNLVKMELEMH